MLSILAVKIGEITETFFLEQIVRFLRFEDPSLVTSLFGCVLLGAVLSLLGSFMVLRKMSLMGDTLGHAVLPGICVAFMLTGQKALLSTFAGAMISGLLGVLLIGWIVRYSRIKPDAALGMILSSFFGLGIVFLTMIQKTGTGNASGLDKFLFGQAAALSRSDVTALAVVTLICLFLVLVFYKELKLASFDPHFAAVLGLPVGLLQTLLMILTTVAVVASIQAVGVVLVSAMLIIPPATALLFVKRVSSMLILAIFLGMISGFFGAFLSFLGPSLPTGPFMVVCAAFFFGLAFLFAPAHGIAVVFFKRRARRSRTIRENILKSIYHFFEGKNFAEERVTLEDLAAFRSETVLEIKKSVKSLVGKKWVQKEGDWIAFTQGGKDLAVQLVRRHRLWELFLVKEAMLPADHVHADAEELEHILPESVMRELEDSLKHAKFDPHGKPIPS
ncbi:MAG: iron chelate uptake ABC transporter family permease subunit [Deltaproteobacteria bacterium]|nr:iron chelate uptake ABC transporter family permease subunit [Deltaproteobacteria bacterium]